MTAAQTGGVFVTTAGGGSQVFTLPAASAGLIYTCIDISATAADDLHIQPALGDSIADCAVDKFYSEIGDSTFASITLVAVNSASWIPISIDGTWTHNSLP